MDPSKNHNLAESPLAEISKDIAELHVLIGTKIVEMAKSPPVNDRLLYGLGESIVLLAGQNPSFVRVNRGMFYDTLIEAGYTDERLKKIPLFRDYTPPSVPSSPKAG